jgi:hypothetical protein
MKERPHAFEVAGKKGQCSAVSTSRRHKCFIMDAGGVQAFVSEARHSRLKPMALP